VGVASTALDMAVTQVEDIATEDGEAEDDQYSTWTGIR
jgi:hypothetical protein